MKEDRHVPGDRPVGLTRISLAVGAAENAVTLVDREYRGRGIARALKLRSTLWARERGIEFLYTSNEAGNTRMLDINTRLGYRPLPRVVELARDM